MILSRISSPISFAPYKRWLVGCLLFAILFSVASVIVASPVYAVENSYYTDESTPSRSPQGPKVNSSVIPDNWITRGMMTVLEATAGGILRICVWFAGVAGDLLDWGLHFKTTNAAVSTGWGIAAGIANMFFLLILIVVSITTILNIPGWNIRRMIVTIFIGLILVNFSMFICLLLIQFGDQLMGLFFGPTEVGVGNSFLDMMGIPPSVTDAIVAPWKAGREMQEISDTVLYYGVMSIFVLVAAVAFALNGLMLIFRGIYLWFLVIFSPIAFLAWILPATKGFFSQWWGKFTKYVFVGPVAAFCIYMGLMMIRTTNDVTTGWKVGGHLPGNINTPQLNVMNIVLGVVFLLMSVIVSQQIGGVGGKLIGNIANRLQGAVPIPFRQRTPLTAYGKRRQDEALKRKSEREKLVSDRLGNVPVLGRLGLGAAASVAAGVPIAGSLFTSAAVKSNSNLNERYRASQRSAAAKEIDTSTKIARSNGFKNSTGVQREAYAEAMAKEGELSLDNLQTLERGSSTRFVESLRTTNSKKGDPLTALYGKIVDKTSNKYRDLNDTDREDLIKKMKLDGENLDNFDEKSLDGLTPAVLQKLFEAVDHRQVAKMRNGGARAAISKSAVATYYGRTPESKTNDYNKIAGIIATAAGNLNVFNGNKVAMENFGKNSNADVVERLEDGKNGRGNADYQSGLSQKVKDQVAQRGIVL